MNRRNFLKSAAVVVLVAVVSVELFGKPPVLYGHGECTCFFDVSASGGKFYSRVSNICGKCLHAATAKDL